MLQEIIDFAKAQSAKLGRGIAIYPETKNPTYHRDLGLLEDKLIAALDAAGWNARSAPVFVQASSRAASSRCAPRVCIIEWCSLSTEMISI